jgi:hypothetical protein
MATFDGFRAKKNSKCLFLHHIFQDRENRDRTCDESSSVLLFSIFYLQTAIHITILTVGGREKRKPPLW